MTEAVQALFLRQIFLPIIIKIEWNGDSGVDTGISIFMFSGRRNVKNENVIFSLQKLYFEIVYGIINVKFIGLKEFRAKSLVCRI